MKKYGLIIFIIFYGTLLSNAQRIELPDPKTYKDTSTSYYVTSFEVFYNLFFNNYSFFEKRKDTSLINFEKFDLRGVKQNEVWTWEIVSPKKFEEITYINLPELDTIEWFRLPENFIIKDSLAFFNLKQNTNSGNPINIDFTKNCLIYNEVWVDCNGDFYYKLEYDKSTNNLYCNVITIYGGCRGMKVIKNWILLPKPNDFINLKISEIWIN